MSRSVRWLFATVIAWGVVACRDNNEHPQRDMSADLAIGLSDQGGGSDLGVLPDGMVVPDGFTCAAESFLGCQGADAVYCSASGTGLSSFDCSANGGTGGCQGTSGCGQCTKDSCTAGVLTSCDVAHQKTHSPAPCVTLGAPVGQCSDATSCMQCQGANVCGDGVSYGTKADTSYVCQGGAVELTKATACAFGCDAANGKCRDLVPANQAAEHLDPSGVADTFTCTGSQSGALPALTAGAGDTLTFDTGSVGAPSITRVNGASSTPFSARWGVAYKPAGSITNVLVAHIRSLDVAPGAVVSVVGPNGLVLLVDEQVSLTGSATATTLVKLNATKYTVSGSGAPAVLGGGGAAQASTSSLGYGGGGGAGHGTAGGKGGGGNSNPTTGGAAGLAYGMTPVLEAGAEGGAGDAAAALGGKGGGALQVSACGSLTITSYVVVNASGGGGKGGALPSGMNPGHGGGGGGSGGTVVLEAGAASLDGALAANGGGGGGGAGSSAGVAGLDGADWSPATAVTTAAAGGASGATGGAAGAPGGTATAASLDGTNAIASYGGGGGGGAVGRIFINLPAGAAAPTIATASPTPKLSHTCVTTNGASPLTCTYP